MSLTILSHNPRLPDEPMMTLITGQPNAAATVDQCEALWSDKIKFVRSEALQTS